MSEGLPTRIGIVGLGLMGGSLARALKALPEPPLIGASSQDPADLEAALAEGTIDEATGDPLSAAVGRDLVVYAAPLSVTLDLLGAHRGAWEPGAVITDLASLKSPVLERMAELGELQRYVGSHPMVGGEGAGFAAARSTLYDGAGVWLTRSGAARGSMETVTALWTAVGADPRPCDAREHDRRMVRTSHLPQLVANALAAALGEAGHPRSELGPGGRDMTRLAGSSPVMWRDLFEQAGGEAGSATRELIAVLERVAGLLEAGDVDAVVRLMERTRSWTRGEPWS